MSSFSNSKLILSLHCRLRRLEVNFPSIPANDLGPFQWDDEPCSDCENDVSNTTRPWRFTRGPPLDGGLVTLKVWVVHLIFSITKPASSKVLC